MLKYTYWNTNTQYTHKGEYPMMRKTITIPEQLDKRIKDYNEKTGIPQSTIIQQAIAQYLDSQKFLDSFPEVLYEMKKMIEENKKDE